MRGGITGVGTFVGGILHSLPFLIPNYHAALVTALDRRRASSCRARGAPVRVLQHELHDLARRVSLAGAVIVAVSATLGATA